MLRLLPTFWCVHLLFVLQVAQGENPRSDDLEDSESGEQDKLIGIMGDTAKRFSSLLTVICRTAKRSANKVAKIRKKKTTGEDMNNVPLKADEVVGSPCKTHVSKSSASSVDEKGLYDLAYKMRCNVSFKAKIEF